MHLQEILVAVLDEYEKKLGKSSSEMTVIRNYIFNNISMSNIDFDIDNANRTFQAINQISGFIFSFLQKLPAPHLAEIISNNLAEFVKKYQQELFSDTSIDNVVDLVFEMFLLVYLETDNFMKNLIVFQYIIPDENYLLINE